MHINIKVFNGLYLLNEDSLKSSSLFFSPIYDHILTKIFYMKGAHTKALV